MFWKHNILPGKGLLFLHGHWKASDHIEVGIELSTGGDLLPVGGTETILDTAVLLSPNSVRSDMAILTGRYSIEKSFGYPFIGIGAGINTYKMSVNALDQRQVSHHNLVGHIGDWSHPSKWFFHLS